MKRKKGKKFIRIILVIVLALIIWNKVIPLLSSEYDVANILDKIQSSPQMENLNTAKPSIVGETALTYDVDDNKILYAKNIHERVYPASLTKLLTAQVFADHMSQNNKIIYTKGAKAQIPNKLDLTVGDVLSGDQAMDSMLIFSANDIAEAIGENVGGNIDNFAAEMNEKARKLGLTESNFVNPNGLHNPNHYTTASDICKIALNVYKYPWIVSTIGKETSNIETPEGNINDN